MAILDQIRETGDVKNIAEEDLPELSEELRGFLIDHISKTGGHLASNLGTVELTIALHRCLNLPEDKIIWDVGHQCYTHKILTGRKELFSTLRQYDGISGFPKRVESDCDCFDSGHSSNSISAGLGMVKARDLAGRDETIVSVIGDGSLTGGMAYEALNNAARLLTNYIIILNDNNMSISESIGGMSKYLGKVRTSEKYLDLKWDVYQSLQKQPKIVEKIRKTKNSFKQFIVPGMWIETLGITYLGPIDGHDIGALEREIREAQKVKKAVLIHVLTKKGKGYAPAERHPARFHGAEPFDVATGVPTAHRTTANYQDIFSTCMCKLGERDEKVVAITAAMEDGTGLHRFHNMFPERFFDAGIAEEHAVSFAAGLALGGFKPIFAVYSSFLQRAYDQILEEVCLQNLPVVFAIDRAGIVGSDGETHQGIFDLSYLSSMPNMTILSPKNKWELSDMLKFATALGSPVAIRYPRGHAYDGLEDHRAPIELGKAEWIAQESGICLFALGSMVQTAEKVRDALKAKGLSCSLVNARFVKPIDRDAIRKAMEHHSLIVTLEENVESGGLGEKVRGAVADLAMEEFAEADESRSTLCIPRVLVCALPDAFITHGSPARLLADEKMDAESITSRILDTLADDGQFTVTAKENVQNG